MSSNSVPKEALELEKELNTNPEVKKQIEKILADDEAAQRKRILELKKQIEEGNYKVSSEGLAHAIASYVESSTK